MDFMGSYRFMKAVNGYEKYESMGKLKWFDDKSRELADEVFVDTMNIMREIAIEYGVSFEDVLDAIRKVSRY